MDNVPVVNVVDEPVLKVQLAVIVNVFETVMLFPIAMDVLSPASSPMERL